MFRLEEENRTYRSMIVITGHIEAAADKAQAKSTPTRFNRLSVFQWREFGPARGAAGAMATA